MSITFTSIVQQQDGSWTFSWNSTGSPNYRVVLYGVLLATVTATSYSARIAQYPLYPPPIEVVDWNELALSELFPPYLIMQWYAVPGATAYQVSENINSLISPLQSVLERGLSQVYTVSTLRLQDDTDHLYELVSVDQIGQDSNPRDFKVHVCTPPTLVETSFRVTYQQLSGMILVNPV